VLPQQSVQYAKYNHSGKCMTMLALCVFCSKDEMGWSAIRLMLRAVIRTILCMCNIIYGVGSYVWWTNMLRPLRWIKPEFYYAIEGTMYRWLQENVAYWLWSAGYTGSCQFKTSLPWCQPSVAVQPLPSCCVCLSVWLGVRPSALLHSYKQISNFVHSNSNTNN